MVFWKTKTHICCNKAACDRFEFRSAGEMWVEEVVEHH